MLGPAGVRLHHLPRDALEVRGDEPLRLEQMRPAHMHMVYLHTELMRPRAHAAASIDYAGIDYAG